MFFFIKEMAKVGTFLLRVFLLIISACLAKNWIIPTCQEEPVIENGKFTKGSSEVGSDRRVVCNDGYQLEGVDTTYCKTGGQWSSVGYCWKEPKCNSKRPSSIANGLIMSNFKVICNRGYKLVGDAQLGCDGNNEWKVPSCQSSANVCGQLPQVSNGFIASKGGYKQGDYHKVKCNEGFKLSGASITICQPNLTWSRLGFCEALNEPVTMNEQNDEMTTKEVKTMVVAPIECQKLPTVHLGELKIRGKATVGSQAKLICDYGFLLEGNGTIECSPDGTWSEPGKCVPILCPMPVIENGFANPYIREVGTRVLFKCNPGYKVQGSTELICQIDQTWLIQGSCVLKMDLPDVKNGVYEQKSSDKMKALLKCDQGFHPYGNVEIFFNEQSKSWNEVGQCLPPCGDMPVIDNGQTNSSNLSVEPVGTVKMIVCNKGSEYFGDEKMPLVCSSNNGHSKWQINGFCFKKCLKPMLNMVKNETLLYSTYPILDKIGIHLVQNDLLTFLAQVERKFFH